MKKSLPNNRKIINLLKFKIQILYMKAWIYIFSLLLLPAFFSCSKNDEDPPPDIGLPVEFGFQELTSSADTILAGVEKAFIKAEAIGNELRYYWSADRGNIAGSGANVEFFTSFCTRGLCAITCTVKDKYHNEDTKEISIFVK
jgi:hypothetical protein